MEKITHYEIVGHRNSQELEKIVRDAIARGYQPLGGVAINAEGFFQTMVGYSQNKMEPITK